MEGYCLKCRTKREMNDEKQITMKNGKPATQGTCPVCGTKMFKIGGGDGTTKAASGEAKSGAKSSTGEPKAGGRSGSRTTAGSSRSRARE